MTMENMDSISMKDMMNEIEKSMKPIYSGDIIEGKVISVSDNEVLVNIGYISDGIIKKEEITDEEISLKEILKPDDEINVYVMKVNDGEGNVVLSKKKADSLKVWEELQDKFEKAETIEVKIKEVIKGGLVAYIGDTRAFIPASQASNSFVKDLNEFVGKSLIVKIIEFDPEKKRVVLSGKEVEKEAAEAEKAKFWSKIKKGDKVSGTVKRLAKFGAFVDIGGVDGLIHNSDLSWGRVNHPSEVVKEGDKVEVFVLDLNKETGKIALGLKDVEKDPWNEIDNNFKINDIVKGKVVRLTDFGAFVEIEKGIEGLVHISQITEENIAKPSQALNIGDEVKVKILELNKEGKKIALSIKEADTSVQEELAKYNQEDEGNFLFADLLKNMKF
ncbi:30S ribosomal protein S1 [Clostridium homopropionicum DSM 5847]|uniref:30S ribosomal protein S1 n=1 Tax=Clostridium homopropionicum DSM 5847 TaxID=1121318 RepID=A0A0L6ZCT6_9CLOT|nr:30S ribosomal protein S1 [Clostridium homopropionicum]KOA20781.1 30S ribosomal protein S1 [Clostridium homopropionicum DSM 5847]SFF89301.1 small subunit ribosomal protein S1 [Clostridium homopropionicum]